MVTVTEPQNVPEICPQVVDATSTFCALRLKGNKQILNLFLEFYI